MKCGSCGAVIAKFYQVTFQNKAVWLCTECYVKYRNWCDGYFLDDHFQYVIRSNELFAESIKK